MKSKTDKLVNETPASLIKLDDAIIKDAGEGEFGCFPPPPDINELKRFLATDKNTAATLRNFGWITS